MAENTVRQFAERGAAVAEEAKKGLFRCVTRSDALGSLTEGSSLHRFWRPSVIRAVAASNLRLRSFVFQEGPAVEPERHCRFRGRFLRRNQVEGTS